MRRRGSPQGTGPLGGAHLRDVAHLLLLHRALLLLHVLVQRLLHVLPLRVLGLQLGLRRGAEALDETEVAEVAEVAAAEEEEEGAWAAEGWGGVAAAAEAHASSLLSTPSTNHSSCTS